MQKPEPKNWHYLQQWGEGWIFVHKCGLRVIIDEEIKSDNKLWIHVSFSRKERTPDWKDISKVKQDFLGSASYAYIVIPPASEYVNLHQYCLHLWSPSDGKPILPEFSGIIAGFKSI